MKSKLWQKLIAAILTLAMAATMLPISAFAVGDFLDNYNLTFYHYIRLTALSSPTRALATNYISANDSTIYGPMIPGEPSYVKFALDYNGVVKIDVYTEDGTLLGPVYGIRYFDHITGSPLTGYKSKNLSDYTIEEQLRARVKDETQFDSLDQFLGSGLSGEAPFYRTLAQYYAFNGLDDPTKNSMSPAPDSTPAPQETPVPTPSATPEVTETPESSSEAAESPAATEEPMPESSPEEEPASPESSEEQSVSDSSIQTEEVPAPVSEPVSGENAPVIGDSSISEAAAMGIISPESIVTQTPIAESVSEDATDT